MSDEAAGLDPGFADSLGRLLAAAPRQIDYYGFRTYDEQAKLYAEKGPGMAAKPGTSWHEFGLAADLQIGNDVGLTNWLHEHAAEYGLFFPMSWEPWHIQPLWTQGRKTSSLGQAPGPGIGQSVQGEAKDAGMPKQSSVDSMLGSFASMMSAPAGFAQQYPQDEGGQDVNNPDTATGSTGATTPVSASGIAHSRSAAEGGGDIDYYKAYNLLIQAGASPDVAKILAAVAGPESSYNPMNHNGNASTGDDSYGLWQINMLGSMGPERRALFGIQSNDQLFDPMTNARAALAIYNQQGFGAWTGYNSGAYKEYLPA